MRQNKILEVQRVSLEGKLEGMMSQFEKYQAYQGCESTKNLSARTSRLVKPETQKFNEASFKQLFLECVKMVKKELKEKKGSQSELLKAKIDDFGVHDKHKVMELLLANPKVDKWLKEKIPSQKHSTEADQCLPRVKNLRRRYNLSIQNQTFYGKSQP